MTPNEQLIRNPMGYLSLQTMPIREELREYYAQKYFQEDSGNYAKQYSKEELQNKKEKFEFINLSNVLEHVIDPVEILKTFQTLLAKHALLRVCIPNDYSLYQDFLVQKNYTTDTWFSPPDHLHYFTFESLHRLFLSLGYKIVIEMGDFPIELYLANPTSNSYTARQKAKDAHTARVEVDNFLFSHGRDKYIDFYKASASIGLSRQIIIYARVLS